MYLFKSYYNVFSIPNLSVQAEEQLKLVEEQRKILEEKQRMEEEEKRRSKKAQEIILNKKNARPSISFSLGSK